MTVPSSQPSTAEPDSADKLCKTQKLLQANKECSSFFVFKCSLPMVLHCLLELPPGIFSSFPGAEMKTK